MTFSWETLQEYGFPMVAAGIMLFLYILDRRRANAREDMLLKTALHGRDGDGNGSPAVRGVTQVVEDTTKAALPIVIRQELPQILRDELPGAMNGTVKAAVDEGLAPVHARLRGIEERVAFVPVALQQIADLKCRQDGECHVTERTS